MIRLSIADRTRGLQGSVTLPASKSISNRALLLSRLCADGPAPLTGVADCEDTRVMREALDYGDNQTAKRLTDYQTNRLTDDSRQTDWQTNRLADECLGNNSDSEVLSDSLKSLKVCQSEKVG